MMQHGDEGQDAANEQLSDAYREAMGSMNHKNLDPVKVAVPWPA